MNKASVSDRTRPTPWDALVVLLVLLGAGLLLFLFRPAEGGFLTATVLLDHVTVAEYDLTALTGSVLLDVPGAQYPITVEADHGRIRVSHSDCPSQDCVRTGWADRSGGQIVCLPNKLVISVTGSAAPEVDGVVK